MKVSLARKVLGALAHPLNFKRIFSLRILVGRTSILRSPERRARQWIYLEPEDQLRFPVKSERLKIDALVSALTAGHLAFVKHTVHKANLACKCYGAFEICLRELATLCNFQVLTKASCAISAQLPKDQTFA